ncbi:uncharacterized protein LOC108192721 [Daucus carota subsp. sativus]|uniref:uncharacterized protein LOC108192721 n=1 Tax=Daucus carota subsp. sativus TaxID=79200 RepID=UPI0007EF4C22|nr:PREDICTED: uncharacterized protein LOC108192721 [Daucus carota subsp. sativus]
MADPKHDPSSTSSFSGKDSVGSREQREVKDRKKSPYKHHRETHGMSDDFDENTPIGDFKGPNVFERAKEEFEAFIDTIHPKKESSGLASGGKNNVTPPKVEVRKEHKEGAERMKSPHKHRRETHGRSDDFDANTPIDDFKGPNVFERAKEEFEALIDTIHHKKESGGPVLSPDKRSDVSPKKKSDIYDCLGPLGKGLEKVCSPGSHKKD